MNKPDEPERGGIGAGDPDPAPVTDPTGDCQETTLSTPARPAGRKTEKCILDVRGHRLQVAVDTAAIGSRAGSRPLLLCNGISATLEAFDPFVRAMPADRVIVRV